MLRWPYLWQPSLDRFGFWIYCFAHTPLPPDRRDLKEHNFFFRNHHQTFLGKQKEIHLQGSFGRQPSFLFSTVGACLFLDMWCAQMLSSFWMVEIGNTLSGKVSFMLNNSSLSFRLAQFYSDLGRSKCWIIPILRYIVHNSRLYILTIGFKNKI